MRKYLMIGLCVLLVACSLAGCAGSAADNTEADSIAFEYFYRGFTPLVNADEIDGFRSVSGTRVILTEEDFYDFMGRFCPGIAYYVADFPEECLITDSSIYGSAQSFNVSCEIKSITIDDNRVVVTVDDQQDLAERIFAINSGFGHWFVNIVKVKRADLPPEVEGVYTG